MSKNLVIYFSRKGQNYVDGKIVELEKGNTELVAEYIRDAVGADAYLHDIKDYDNIVIAGPCWWGTYPCAVFAQLEKLHFRGKHVFPVMTHEGSGEANARSDLKKFCTHAKVEKAFAIQGSAVPESEERVAAWAQKHLGE